MATGRVAAPIRARINALREPFDVNDAEYAALDGLGIGAAIADGTISADEALTAARRRADAVNPAINAVVREMDREAAAQPGASADGPFAGVPFLIKDLGQDYAGLPTSSGCRALSNVPMPEHATVVQRWIDAGLVIFGKTNTPEFGAKGVTESDLLGPCRNPYDLSRTPGGSSGGAAAAVAAGIVPVAGASDGGGSIRIPAGCCGLFGLKAGRGVIPNGPRYGELLQGSATHGVISRSVRDSAAMLDVLAGQDPVAPYHVVPSVGSPYRDEVGKDPGKLRIGFVTTSSITPDPHPDAVAAVEGAAALLEGLGHHVEAVAAPQDDARLAREFLTTWFVSVAAEVAETMRVTGSGPEGFEQDTLLMAALGRATSGLELHAALEGRHEHVRALADFHTRYDLLMTPTMSQAPIEIGALDTPRAMRIAAAGLLKTRTARFLAKTPIPDKLIEENLGWVPYTQLANITGRPASSVPLHWTADGLPLGIQFVADLGGERTLLRLAAQLEQAQPWADRRPQL